MFFLESRDVKLGCRKENKGSYIGAHLLFLRKILPVLTFLS